MRETFTTRQNIPIEEEQQREVYIFDMDGTLYQFSGNGNGYNGSFLERKVRENAELFIMKNEKRPITPATAKRLRENGEKDPVGLSSFCARRYGITRDEYFNETWDINPDDMLKNCEETLPALLTLRKRTPQAKFVLLTSAPKVWARRVLEFIGIDSFFEEIFTGDIYRKKDEVFEMFAKRYPYGKVTSIGDQPETDLKPAERFGLKLYQVFKPSDLRNIP